MTIFTRKLTIPFHLILLFFLCLIPFAATLIQHYPDEWHYINSVILMQQNGDYLTPHNMSFSSWNKGGFLRLNKPIMSYWVILTSFKIFGVHVFSLRVFFLLAGVLAMLLTAVTSQMIFSKREVTQFAVIILMTQIQFIFASVRAIPDILLVLFLMLSAYGLLRLLTQPNQRSGFSWWCLYVGAALAIESKGLLALLFVAYSIIFLWFTNRAVFNQHRLAQVLAALCAIMIAGAWYFIMWIKYGNLFIQAFLFDQVTWRVHHAVWLPVIYIPYSLLMTILCLLPWSLLAIRAAIRSPQAFRSNIYKFILGWSLLVGIVIGCGTTVSPRYLLPLAPLLALLCADIILQADIQKIWSKYCFRLSLLLFILGGIIFSVIIAQIFSITQGLILLIIVTVLAVLIFQCVSKYRWFDSWVGAGLLLFLIFIMSYLPLSIIILPTQAQQIVNSLNILDPDNQLKIDFIGPNRLASNVRLLSAKKIDPHYLATSVSRLELAPNFPLVVSSDNARQLNLPRNNQKKVTISKSLARVSITEIICGVLTWTLPAKLKTHEEEYWLITTESQPKLTFHAHAPDCVR